MEIKKILAGLLASAVTVGMLAVPAFADFETVEKASADENFEEVTAALAEDTNWADSAKTDWYNDTESEYTLNTAEELAGLASLVNSGTSFAKKTVKLGSDIDLKGIEWTPIGKSGSTFQGIFDGNGNTIKNLLITGSKSQCDVGLFGFTTSGEIKNFTLENAQVSGYLDVGAVAGTPYTSKYTNITVKGVIKIDGYAYVGGAFGKNGYANLTNVDVLGNSGSYVKADSEDYRTYIGGLIGFMGEGNQTIADCDVAIDVIGSTCDVGGITGILHYGNKMVNCTYSGNLALTNATDPDVSGEIGGLAGTYLTNPNHVTSITGSSATVSSAKVSDGTTTKDIKDEITSIGTVYSEEHKTNGECTVSAKVNGKEDTFTTNVANIGDVKYFSLESAVAAALASGKNETVTMLCNADGNGIIIPAGANITIDFGGYSYTIDGTLVGSNGSETNGFQLLKDANVTLKNGTIISSKLAKWGPTTDNAANATGANIVIQNYSNLRLENITIDGDQSAVTEGNPSAAYARYVLSNNNGNTVLTGNTNIIAAPGNYAFDVYGGWYPAYPFVTVTLDENMTGTITGKIQVSNGEVAKPDNFKLSIKNGTIDGTIQDDRSAAQKETYPKLNAVSGGSFTTDVSDYCEDGFAPRFVNGKYVVGEDNSATTIKLIFKQPDANDNTLYNIVLSGVEKNINRLNAAEFKFALTTTDAITYEIAAADGLALIPQAEGMYEFHFDGKDFTGGITDTGAEIVIGTVKFEGYGKFTFFAETGRATATTTEDNLVTEFVVAATDGKGTLVIGEDENKINTEIKVPKQILTINIAMNHPVTDNVSAYQDMKVVISGGDLAGETLTFDLGTEEGAYALVNSAYKFDVELTQNRLYTVTVSGAGYRTARYTVAMTEDKTMNFWNNVMSNEITVVDDVKDTVNFLAGDIVKDGKINIYDLSAVVAYFGTENNQAEYSKFAKYDLNRDGKIDMMDISIVLTSWGK